MKLNEIKQLIEGGAALKKATKGVRIDRADIPSTIKYVSKLSGIPVSEMVTLGSVGKSSTSGDIDLAIDVTKYNPEKIHTKMVDKLGDDEVFYNKGMKIGSYAVPIAGTGEKGKIQVDFMYVENVNWAAFAYYSEGDNSKWKGAIRTILLTGVAAAINEPGIDYFEYEPSGDLRIRAGRTFDRNKGLRRIFQHRPEKKIGTGYVKTMKSIPIEQFKKLFPHIEIRGTEMVLDDPALVVKVLFGPNTKVSDVRTAEQVLELIKNRFNKAEQDKIFRFAKANAKSLKNVKIPKEFK